MKYIVYKTTNLINGKVYVGVHKTKNPDVFDGYIGCGVCSRDLKNCIKTGFPAAVKKYGYENFKREILFVYDYTEQGKIAAYAKEAEIVNEEWIRRDDNYNLVKGGRRECASEQKEKTVYQFDLAGNLIKVWKSAVLASYEFKNLDVAKTAIWNVCNKRSKSAYGYYWSYKSKFEYVPNERIKAIAMYDDNGIFLECFNSIKEATIRFHVSDGNICAAIKGKLKHCAGYRWRYFYGNKGNIKPLK